LTGNGYEWHEGKRVMTKRTKSVLFVLLVCGLLLTTTTQTSGSKGYDLSWWTVDGGGGTLSIEGGYSLSGSIGQPDAEVLTSNDYVLSGGFWAGRGLAGGMQRVYLPLVLRSF
jgi:hypothetical protein